ncbi:MAG: DUF4238 domain-containing protein [Clostridiales bacterium]|jgi:hypothetical protein|nr:DUF4238 domain-containing protein [Clostridiales bacterium]
MEKQYNHIYPWLHIKKWAAFDGKIFNKSKKQSHRIKLRREKNSTFTIKYYYSLGEPNDELENRIELFEVYIGDLIKKIDEAESSILLNRKEIELLKLYVALCACRQHNTTEVIKDDQSKVYRSNNYGIGVPRVATQKDAVVLTNMIIDDFERIKKLPDNKVCGSLDAIYNAEQSSVFTRGQHLCIFRSETSKICVSNVCSIIENTMDSDYLYCYTPISPRTALLLVKSEYYYDKETFEYTKIRFGATYGGHGPIDSHISEILGRYNEFDSESELFCSYRESFLKDCSESVCTSREQDKAAVKISNIPDFLIQLFNSIFYEDGDEFIYLKDEELEFAQKYSLNCRKIIVVNNEFA